MGWDLGSRDVDSGVEASESILTFRESATEGIHGETRLRAS